MSGRRPVLWLDDIEPFIAQGVSLDTLREWHRSTEMPVLGTYGGKGSERIGDSAGMRELTELTRTLLQHAREIHLETTRRLEVDRIASRLTPEVRDAIERHGLAAYLVAAPALERKLTTRRHELGEPEAPAGAAIVFAAADWSLCGRTDPIPKEVLERLWPAYLPAGAEASPDSFMAALEWALRPVEGTIALVFGAGAYAAYDYIVGFIRDRPEAVDPKDEAWECATETEDPNTAFAVGVSAWAYDRSEYAVRAFTTARDRGAEGIAGIAGFDLALAYRRQGNTAAAKEAYEWTIRSADANAAPNAAAALGVLLQQQGDLHGAELAFQRALDSGHPDAAPRAAVSLGVLLEMQGQVGRARTAYEFAAASRDLAAASVARFELGVLMEEAGDLAGARMAYEEAVASGHDEAVHAGKAALRRLAR
jgi:tetratricopeptide (TPR) repeat protein